MLANTCGRINAKLSYPNTCNLMVHPESPIPRPSFIPRFLHTDTQHAEEFGDIPAAMVTANFVASNYRVDAEARESAGVLLIDPQTNYFTYEGFLERATYREIPYAPDEMIRARHIVRDDRRTAEFTGEVLDFQREHGAGVLLAPYLYARDLDDARYVANLRLLSRAVDQLEDDERLYAVINLSGSVLRSPALLEEIAEQYREPGPDGFLLCFENVDDRNVSHETLYGLARLTQRLSPQHDVFIYPIAAFGQALTALGANGFVSGVGWLEVFRETSMHADRTAFATETRYYVPELFSYLHPEEARAAYAECADVADFRCRCRVCEARVPDEAADKKRHFLIRRFAEMREIGEAENPVQHVRDRLNRALELAEIVEDEALVRVDTAHLITWLQVLDAASRGGAEAESIDRDELDELIEEERARGNE